ncbi:hypothetical protein F511_34636 [Dorcoceras hygrometricum]|uniref:non-specific serine/threonine protein kinase n=1 Tax=Dorcoceras hygrometricum TaxID=472368 RepID=A0A2Z7AZB6_9LAMI|nr:hypothetical protein F511_34636 [Dorcoceras hygrometricum]
MASSPQQSPQTAPPLLKGDSFIHGSFQTNSGQLDGESSSSPPPSTSPPPELSPPAPPTSPPPPPYFSPPPEASDQPTSPPPPEASTPPPEESTPPPLPQSPPPPQAPPPDDSSSPPPPASFAPPPSSTPSSPPPLTLYPPPAPGSSPVHAISPPPPGAATSPTPPSPPHLPRSGSANRSSSPSPGSEIGLVPPPPNATENPVIIAGIVVGGVVFLALIIACLILSRRKKKPSYYVDPGRPPAGGDLYYDPSTHWHSPVPVDQIVNLKPPPGVMGTPAGVVGGGWGAPISPPLVANTSSDFSSSYSSQHPTPMQQPQSPNMGGIGSKSQFTYEELKAATDGFSQSNLLGQGGFGLVYKGVLPDGTEVAVKSLKSGSGQGERKGQPVMDWATRLRIAIGSAKGLAYLHEDCHPRIIHRDIKAANILLDYNFEAMVADFGLAKLTSDSFTHVSTRVMGTFGYLAPEYASSGKLTARPLLSKSLEHGNYDSLEDGNYDSLVDSRLEDNYIPHEIARMVACAAACIRHSARRRPKMSHIVRALDGDSSLEDLNEGVKQGQSTTYSPNGNTETYDTRAYNADMMKFKKMVTSSHEFNSSEYGATSEYGLNPSSSSSDSGETVEPSSHKRRL